MTQGPGRRRFLECLAWGGTSVLDFWAVSDVEAGELEAFHKAFAARPPV